MSDRSSSPSIPFYLPSESPSGAPFGALEEKIIHQNRVPHYALYPGGITHAFMSEIPWHWHGEFEFGYVQRGRIRYKTSCQEVILSAGDGIFINSGVLHTLTPLEEVQIYSQFIDGDFLAGVDGEFLYERYVRPVAEAYQLDALPLFQTDPAGERCLAALREGIRLAEDEGDFYELKLRRVFLELWQTVFRWAEKSPVDGLERAYDPIADGRMKEMIRFIQQHFPEPLRTADVADAAHISERECYRLFQSRIGLTPAEFLLSVRMRQAVELLYYTQKSVLEIAVETGFGSSSYFGKRFKEQFSLSPGQFRTRRRSGDSGKSTG